MTLENTIMDTTEGNTLWDPEALSEFADVLKQYKLRGEDQSFDEFDIVREFRFISAKKARSILEQGTETAEFEDWDLEVKLWDLVENLLKYRYAEKQTPVTANAFNSDIVFEEQLLTGDPALYEIWIIISWIQMNSNEVDRPENLSATKWLQTQLSNTLESVDSDAPIRLGKQIDSKDQEQDSVFYKYIFDLVLAGKDKEASTECDSTNNWTLKMILAGANSYLDPILDKQVSDDIDDATHGIKKQALWRRTVYLLSKNDAVPLYERAIYSYLAGDLSALELSTTWDSDFLIYLNHIFTREMEQKLIDSGRVPKEDLIMNFPRTETSVQKVLNTMSFKRREESEHPLRVLVGSVISNNIPAIMNSSIALVGNVMLGKHASNEITNEPYLLRVVTHLAIFVSIIDPSLIDVEDRSKLITTYIMLLRLYEHYDLIPLYVSFLPEIEARNAYSLFLIDLYDAEARPKQLELSRLYDLPLENILKKTVERVFAVTESKYQIKNAVSLRKAIDDDDLQMIRGVEWFVDAKMYSDAIHASVMLFRRFLLTGRAKAAQEFASRHNLTQLLKHYDVESMGVLVEQEVTDNEREELLQYHHLVLAFNAIDEWKNSPKRTSTYAFVDTMTRVSTTIKATISTLFLDLSSTDYDQDVILELRSLYIPFLIIELHNIFVDGSSQRSSLLTEALSLTNLVASESTKFYQLFQHSNRLTEYLDMVARCAAHAAGEGL